MSGDGTVGFHVQVRQFGRTLKVDGNGAVYDSAYDARPAIGAGFLTAAAVQAGVDSGKALALVADLAGMIRTDHDVVDHAPQAGASGWN